LLGAFVLLTMSGFLAAALAAAVLAPLGVLSTDSTILQLALVHMALAGGRDVLFSLLVGREQHGRFAWLNAATVVAGAVTGVGILAAGWGILAYIVTQIAVHVASMLPAWYLAQARLPRAAFDPRLWWQLTRGGAPFLGWGIALVIRGQVGVLIVGALLSEQVAGWYFAAQRIAGIPAFIPIVLATPLFPVLSRIAADRTELERTLHHVLVAVLLLTVLPGAIVIGLAPAIPNLLGWQASFGPSVPVMMVLALFLPFLAFNMVLGTALMAINRERQWLMVSVVAAIINPMINLGLIPLSQTWFENGAIGLAIAEVTTEALMVVGALIVMPRGLVGGRLAWLSMRILVAGGGAAAVATALRPTSLFLAIAASGLVYLAVVAVLRVVRPADLSAFWEIMRQSASRRLASEPARMENEARGDAVNAERHRTAAPAPSFLTRCLSSVRRREH
jgi:O-antigen/teichoic acid export membrane protein